jgi:DNA polymerase-1
LEFDTLQPVVQMALAGAPINHNGLHAFQDRLGKEAARLKAELKKITGLVDANYKSPNQVQGILKHFGFEVESSDKAALTGIDHPFAKTMLEYREVTKQRDAFALALEKHIHPVSRRIHPEFLQLGTETGRFSCRNPNLQQIPQEKEWRSLFAAPAGYKVITADYSQIELRILAEVSGDETFLDAYRNGQDIHARTAAEMYGVPVEDVTKEQRGSAKAINFGLCYGMGEHKLADSLGITTEEAAEFIRRYFAAYPNVKKALDSFAETGAKTLEALTLSGRKRAFRKPMSVRELHGVQRQAKNTPIQGTCGDIVKQALKMVHAYIVCADAWIFLTVHDELVLCVHESLAEDMARAVKELMEEAGRVYIKKLPIVVDVTLADTWSK